MLVIFKTLCIYMVSRQVLVGFVHRAPVRSSRTKLNPARCLLAVIRQNELLDKLLTLVLTSLHDVLKNFFSFFFYSFLYKNVDSLMP